MTPLPFVWPYWPAFWAVLAWAYSPELGIVRRAQKAAARAGSRDAGSISVIVFGGGLASLLAFPLAWVSALRVSAALAPAALVLGVVLIVAGSLIRRHCFRQLGASFTGDVRAEPGQRIVTSGAYRWRRHPAYSAGILMNMGFGVALDSWASMALLAVAAFAAYAYRIAVEERTLLAVVGEPYREFMSTRKRLIPFIY